MELKLFQKFIIFIYKVEWFETLVKGVPFLTSLLP